MRLSAAMIENIRLRVSPEEKHALRAAANKRRTDLVRIPSGDCNRSRQAGSRVMSSPESDLTLMAFWSQNKSACRAIGTIVTDARAGKLAGVEPLPSGFGFRVTDERAALAAMAKA